jgi:hypothetical protein
MVCCAPPHLQLKKNNRLGEPRRGFTMNKENKISPECQLMVDAFIMVVVAELGTVDRARVYLKKNIDRIAKVSMIDVKDSYDFIQALFKTLKHFHTVEPDKNVIN